MSNFRAKQPDAPDPAALASFIAKRKPGKKKTPAKGRPDVPTPGDTRDAAIAQFVGNHGR